MDENPKGYVLFRTNDVAGHLSHEFIPIPFAADTVMSDYEPEPISDDLAFCLFVRLAQRGFIAPAVEEMANRAGVRWMFRHEPSVQARNPYNALPREL